MNICVLIATVFFVVYIIVAICQFGIPASISNTYYLYNEKKKGLGIVFQLFLVSAAFLIMPYMISVTPESYQILAFISSGALTFVGCAPCFKMAMEKNVHVYSALIAAIGSIVWMMLVDTKIGISTLISFLVVMPVAGMASDTLKSCKTFWLECIAFGSLCWFLMVKSFGLYGC